MNTSKQKRKVEGKEGMELIVSVDLEGGEVSTASVHKYDFVEGQEEEIFQELIEQAINLAKKENKVII